MRPRLSVVATVIFLLPGLGGLAACGQSPTAAGGASSETGAADDLEEVYDELEGLEGEERLAKLEELAVEEDAEVTWYTSMNLEDSNPVTDGFNEKYPEIEIEIYRASSSDVLQRVLQESSAGYEGADLVAVNGPEMQILDGENLLLPLKTPTRADISEFARFDTWLGIYLNVFAAGWNTERLSPSEAPKTWEEVLTGYDGSLAMELGDWDWFATLVQHYFVEKKGMTEQEAIDLFHQAARGATIIDGHTTMAELLAAGQFDLVSSAYQHRLRQLGEEGAPVEWDPPPEPLILRANGVGIYRDTDAPATSLLFIEYALTEGQETIVDANRTPANTTYPGLPPELDTLAVDFDEMLEDRDKWEKLYEEVVQESGEDVVEGN